MEWSSPSLASFAREFTADGLDEAVVEAVQRVMVDSLACSLNAVSSPPVAVLRDTYGARRGPDGATVFGSNSVVPVEYAALINGAMVRYLDYNDAYVSGRSVCHPSDHIPALISVAESEGATGAELIEAVVVAYEIECRGVDTGAAWQHGFDYVTWGAFSTAAAAGKLMGLSQAELVNALGIAGAAGNGLLISRLGSVSMWKGVAHSYVAHNAIQACQLARAGMTGPEDVFAGPGGFFEVVSNGPLDRVNKDDPLRMLKTNVKQHACGYFMQSSIEATKQLVEDQAIDPDAITSIQVETFDQAVQVLGDQEKWSTDLNRETADHSIPYTTALAVLEGTVRPEHFGDEWLDDPRVHELMQTVTVTANPALSEHRAEHPGAIPAAVTIETTDGAYTTRVDRPIGHASNPMSEALLHRKARSLLTPVLPADQIEELLDACHRLAELESLDEFVDTLAP